MSYLDKTFCASPRCNNDCGRRMTDEERERLTYSQAQYVSYGYFCGEQDGQAPNRLKAVRMQPMSEAEFKEMYEQNPEPIDERHK